MVYKKQALNNLAVTDENKLMIVEAGALPHYAKLLSLDSEKFDEQQAAAAAHGLWLLAFMYKGRIIKEEGCIEGCYSIAINYCAGYCLLHVHHMSFLFLFSPLGELAERLSLYILPSVISFFFHL